MGANRHSGEAELEWMHGTWVHICRGRIWQMVIRHQGNTESRAMFMTYYALWNANANPIRNFCFIFFLSLETDCK